MNIDIMIYEIIVPQDLFMESRNTKLTGLSEEHFGPFCTV